MNRPLPIDAILAFRSGDGARVGGDRIALLEAIRDEGSISAGARRMGLSYKAAWDAVQALNNLFDRPLVLPQAGGKAGGASAVTPAGEALIVGFHEVEAELAEVADRLRSRLAAPGGPSLKPLLWSMAMKTSARNALRGVVARVLPGAVNAEVALRIAEDVEIIAIVTNESVADLALAPGREALALIKASMVILAPGHAELRTSARNSLKGVVARREDGTVNSEVTLELAAGKTITATLTRESVETLELRVGQPAMALIKASHVILAAD